MTLLMYLSALKTEMVTIYSGLSSSLRYLYAGEKLLTFTSSIVQRVCYKVCVICTRGVSAMYLQADNTGVLQRNSEVPKPARFERL
jgi:hypothetical protein